MIGYNLRLNDNLIKKKKHGTLRVAIVNVALWICGLDGQYSPDGRLHRAVIGLPVVQLREEREENLDSSNRVDGAVDGVSDDGLHILHTQAKMHNCLLENWAGNCHRW